MAASEREVDRTEVYLRYLPRSATEASVRELLKGAGTIRRVWMSRDADGACKGFAFVNFSENREARECVLRYNAHPKNYLDGKHVVIEHAKAWEGTRGEESRGVLVRIGVREGGLLVRASRGLGVGEDERDERDERERRGEEAGKREKERRRRGDARWKSAEESAVEDALGGEGETAGEEARREGSRRRRRLTARRRIRGASARTARARTRAKVVVVFSVLVQ